MKNWQVAIILFFLFTACLKNEIPEIENQEELITTLNITLTPENSSENIYLKFQDIDGEGGINPVILGETLSANTTYICTLTLLDESKNPVEDIGLEIQNESEEHQFFVQPSQGLSFSYEYLDFDANNKPLGLNMKWKAGASSQGSIRITLRHEPNKNAANVSEGEITNAGGETDIEVDFPIIIQ